MDERKVYLETKERLKRLRQKCKRLKKKNQKQRRTEKQINFLVNQDFHKWTNAFSRKSVLWDKKKQALIGENVTRTEKNKNLIDSCCGLSPERYGHQIGSPYT